MKGGMKSTIILWVLAGLVLFSCQKSDPLVEFTGNQVVYALLPGSTYSISGTALLKEKKDGSTQVVIELTGTSGDTKHPVHLHKGDLAEVGAPIAAMLTPVAGRTGKSTTDIFQLEDETKISYQEFIKMKACIKVHLAASGPSKDVILAAGNIGIAVANPGGRLAVGICRSN